MTSHQSSGGGERKESIIPLFPLLASHDQTTRLDASYTLLQALPLPHPPPNDADTPYAVKRLLAGLQSSNESARQGFAVALAQLLHALPDDRAQRVLPQFHESTTSRAGLDAREERDLLFAKLVGSHALVRSGVLVRPTGDASNHGESWKDVVQGLVTLANKKTWIREPSYWVICQAIEHLALAPPSEWKQDVINWAVQRLVNDAREKAKGWGPDKIAVVLTLQAHGIALRGALQSTTNPFENSASSSKTPRQGSNAVKTSKNGAAPAPGQNPHFVWNMILDNYYPRTPTAAASIEDRASWADYWRVCVDDSLFGSPSLPLKSLGFSLVQSALQVLPPSQIATVFGPATLRVFANHLRKSSSHGTDEKTLSRVADKLANSLLPAYLAEHPEATLPVLKVITLPPNSHPGAFETKFVEKLVARLPLNGVKGWVAYLERTLFLSPPKQLVDAPTSVKTTQGEEHDDVEMQDDEDARTLELAKEKRILAVRTWSLDQLLHVARNGGVVKDDEISRGLIEFLAVVGWFDVKKQSDSGARSYVADPPLSTAQRQAARSRFFSVLTALLTAITPTTTSATAAAAAGPAAAQAASGTVWLSRAYQTLENLDKDSKHFSPATAAAADDDEDDDDEDLNELKRRARDMYEVLAKPVGGKKDKKAVKDDGEDHRRKVARSLIEGVLLVESEEKGEALEVIEQLCDALPMLFPTLLAAYKTEPEDDDDDDDEEQQADVAEPTTVLVSLLLSLLQRPSAFVKAVAAEVVEGFAGEMGEQAVGLLVETIAPVPEEQDEAAQDEADADDESTGAEKKGKKVAVADGADESGDSDDSGDDEDDDDEVDEQFRAELLKALEAGGLAPLNDEDGEGSDGEESEEELLDDDAMMELDDKLADIFRANGGGRKTKKRDRTDDLHYRLRLLDLLEVLARKRPSSPLLIPTFVPLLNLARSTAPLEVELRNKASKLVRFLVQPRKAADSISPPSPDAALEALEELHALAHGVEISEFAPIVAQTAIALVKAALASPAADAATSRAVSTLFADAFEQYLATKNARTKVQPLLTTELCKRQPAAAWGMFDRVVQLAKGEVEVEAGRDNKTTTVNAFRRMQAFDVAQTLLVSNTNLKTPESTQAVLAGIPLYESALLDAVSGSLLSSTPSQATFDASRLKQLVKHALHAARASVQLSKSQPDASAAKWSVDRWVKLVDAAKNNERFKGAVAVQTLIKQLVSVLGGSVVEQEGGGAKKDNKKKDKKRKATEEADPAGDLNATTTTTPSKGSSSKKAKGLEEDGGMNGVEVEVEMDEDDVVAQASSPAEATPSKKDKKDKKKRRRSEGKA